MLRTLEITAEVAVPRHDEPFHNLHWQKQLELSLDCFICRRTDRTTFFRHGEEQALCSGSSDVEHPAAGRISAFDVTTEPERQILRALIDYWWAPFKDKKRNQTAVAPTRAPGVRLSLGYLCPEKRQTESFGLQSNVQRPASENCTHCAHLLATSTQAPRIRLLT
ncbi:hypothetical protein [Streptomyces roseifaciens]|uniref:hypothetical protein n=1 Tax=Streptomyces roseifaciens TaxID=1488406 RepID=UPI00071816A8|nr:hypothetical protein [Streptomyces roseifaciens]